MKREFLFLRIGRRNPAIMVEGRATERGKEERKTLAFDRYYQNLKQRKETLEEEKPLEDTKQPRVSRPIYPVSNYQSPVVQQRGE